MTAASIDTQAKGRVLRTEGDEVVFQPANSSYELKLEGSYNGPLGRMIRCTIRVKARKVYTVPSGGNFIQPIFGTPRILQGRAMPLDEKHVVVHAGVPVVVELPADTHAIDLNRGPISAGGMINVVALPGASVEFSAT